MIKNFNLKILKSKIDNILAFKAFLFPNNVPSRPTKIEFTYFVTSLNSTFELTSTSYSSFCPTNLFLNRPLRQTYRS